MERHPHQPSSAHVPVTLHRLKERGRVASDIQEAITREPGQCGQRLLYSLMQL